MSSRTQLWQRYCDWRIADPELGFSLDVSRMSFGDDFVERMRPALDAAFDAMAALESGAIANPDEQRQVGHYWLRAPELAPSEEIRRAIVEAGESVRRFARSVHEGRIAGGQGPFRNLLHVGIGGSALGPQLVSHALGGTGDRLRARFLDNTDPDGIDLVLSELAPELGRTLVTVASKSGSTPEPRNAMREVQAAYRRAGLDPARHFVAITGADSKLDREAAGAGWLARFPIWDWVGGRTSVLSPVGLVPAALQGVETEGLLRGAAAMDRLTREREVRRNPAAMLALMWHHAGGGRGAKDMVILPYKDRLLLMARYLQQLVMESLGKELDRAGRTVHQGIAVYGNKGSTDQHAYVQQLREGVANFFVTFIQVGRERAGRGIEVDAGTTSGDYLLGFLLGTRRALHDNGRDSITIRVDRVSAESLGALIALYERAVGLYAELIDVNAYHQPGVEAGKQAAAAVLELQRRVADHVARSDAAATAEQIAAAIDRADDVETVFQILEHLAANGRGVAVERGETPARATFRRA